ncbi:MAG: single-stranded DNA-binding protein [Mucilaginibacter sp.]|nr:single-stranded DNA-binding protein [Mucilaginibacter sp.]
MPFNATVNRVFLLGQISDDPTWQQNAGKSMLYFTLDTTEEIKKGDSTLEHIEQHRIKIPADIAGNALIQKGKSVYIQGKVQTRGVFEDGVKMYRAEILVSSIEVLKTTSHKLNGELNRIEDAK